MLFKKFQFSLFSIFILTFLYSKPVYANEVTLNSYNAIVENSVYEIIHAESGKLLDIKDVSFSNGAELQIWEDTYAHDNQKFIFRKDDLGWLIIPLHSKKVIEVRDSRTDDGAPIAQWDDAHILTQRWFIADNNDGTVTFVNKNALKVLDVQNNGTNNGTKVWLYSYNGTQAQKFYLRQQQASDLISATWTRDFSQYPMETENYPFLISNATHYHIDAFKKPVANKKYISKIDFLSEPLVLESIKSAARKPDIIDDLKALFASNFKDESIESIEKTLKEIGIKVPGIDTALAIAEILITHDDNVQWNNFLDNVQSGYGIIKITYTNYEVVRQQKLAGMFPNQDTFWIMPIQSYEYRAWDQQSLNIDNIDFNIGTWNYYFK